MKRVWSVARVLAFVMLLSGAIATLAGAQEIECPQGQFKAKYWNNQNYSGDPVLVRCEQQIINYWGEGSPDPSVNVDGFSVMWEGFIDFEGGRYDFIYNRDDFIKVFIEWNVVVEDACCGSARRTAEVEAGTRWVRVYAYEGSGGATAVLTWQKSVDTCPDGQFKASYWNNKGLQGDPLIVQCEPEIDYYWKNGGPHPAMPIENFAARWEGVFDFNETLYTFNWYADDSFTAFFNEEPMIDAFCCGPGTRDIPMPAGKTNIRVDYVENEGHASSYFTWGKTQVTCPVNQYKATYWNRVNEIVREPALIRCENDVNYDWVLGSPDPAVQVDEFFAHWIGQIEFDSTKYRLSYVRDDFIDLKLDGITQVNQGCCGDGAVEVEMSPGVREVEVSFYEGGGGAAIRTIWEDIAPVADTDGDGYADNVDACPTQGDQGAGLDANGCPLAPPAADSDDTSDYKAPTLDCVRDLDGSCIDKKKTPTM